MSDRRGAETSARPEGGLRAEDIGCPGPKPAAERSDRRGAVILIQRGDPQIAGALMRGVLAGRTDSLSRSDAATAPSGREPFGETVESVEIVTVEADKWRRVARQVRVAIGNTKTPEDYQDMIIKARGYYAVRHVQGHMHTVAGKLLLGWAMLCLGIRRAYRKQDAILGRRS